MKLRSWYSYCAAAALLSTLTFAGASFIAYRSRPVTMLSLPRVPVPAPGPRQGIAMPVLPPPEAARPAPAPPLAVAPADPDDSKALLSRLIDRLMNLCL
jgi:hypothetical protein